MSSYYLHVNHPNDKARIHVSDSCASVRKAVERIRRGEPYGPTRGDVNGYFYLRSPLITSLTRSRNHGLSLAAFSRSFLHSRMRKVAVV